VKVLSLIADMIGSNVSAAVAKSVIENMVKTHMNGINVV
jgi:hypothetical protein